MTTYVDLEDLYSLLGESVRYYVLLELALVALLDDYVARDGFVVTHEAIDDILQAVMT